MATSASDANGPTLPSGSRVVLVVSSGPALGPRAGASPVPEVVGRTQGEALQRLQRAELNAQVFSDFSDRVKRGHVIDQFPLPGASAAHDSGVTMLVSSGVAEQTPPTRLPDVVGLSEADAIFQLAAASLEAEVVRDHHPNVPSGLVLAQLPSQLATTTSSRGERSRVWPRVLIGLLVVALGAAGGCGLLPSNRTPVPNVVGLTEPKAVSAITAAGFSLGIVSTQIDPSRTPGTVKTQDPQAGVKAAKGSPVDITVAIRRVVGPVPNVVGLAQADAITALRSAGFTAQSTEKYSDSVPIGNVIDQTPVSGTTARLGSPIAISVSLGAPGNSLGAPGNNVTLPDLTGMPQAAAVDKATSLGLTARVTKAYSSTISQGNVIDQTPVGGQSVAPKTTIAVAVSLGAAPASAVTLPDLRGQTSTSAHAALTGLGLLGSDVQWDGTGQPAGAIVDQSPKPGEQVATNATIVLFVSSGH